MKGGTIRIPHALQNAEERFYVATSMQWAFSSWLTLAEARLAYIRLFIRLLKTDASQVIGIIRVTNTQKTFHSA